MQSASTLYQQASQHHRAGEFLQAISLYQQVLLLQPDSADALHMIGVANYQRHEARQAIFYISQALALYPRHLDYLNNYGLALQADNQSEAALKCFQQAILLQPKDLEVQLNIGNLLFALNRFEEAAAYYRRVVRVFPQKEDVRTALCHCLTSLGNIAHDMGNFKQAEACFQEALVFNPNDPVLFYNLGNAQRELGKAAEAAKQYLKALALNANDADIYNNLGNVQRELGEIDLAIESYQKALAIDPKLFYAKVHLIHQKQHFCDWQNLQEEVNEIRQWVKTEPQAQISPFAFLSMPGTTVEEQKLCADNWVNNKYKALYALGRQTDFYKAAPANLKKIQSKKIKIAYLSADFRLHPLAFLVSELFEMHDRTKFEIHGYSYGVDDKSSARARLVKAFDHFHDIRQLSEIEAAKKIFIQNIDILVDLTGFTQNSRSGIAALRPAPINLNWLGFAGTMGSFNNGKDNNPPLFDYILSDIFITPPGASQHYAEELILLPNCYQPNDRKRPIGKKPFNRISCHLPEHAFVFCSFNQSFKITPDVFAVWMRLLSRHYNSVLWLLDCNPWAKQHLISEAAKNGVSAERLIFAPRLPVADHLARHALADLFLDTQPYNAHTTCSDALWMGLPVLTCSGNTFSSRVAGSLLKAAGLNELITYSLQEYENKAIYLASHPHLLIEMREKLLAEKTTSRLFDMAIFTKSLESAYHKIWQRHLKLQNK